MRALVAGLLVAQLGFLACGYSIVRHGGGLGDVRSVAIVTFENRSYEPGAEVAVSEALRREFLRRGGLRLSDDPESADLVVRGRVNRVSSRGRSFSSVELALEYELTVSVDIDLHLTGGRLLDVGSRAQRGTEIYLASADVEALRKNRQEALRRVASVIAGRVYDSLYLELGR